VNRIRAGRPWDEEVQKGLRNSQLLLALLSPQSVRRPRDVGNPTATDSVCLDEIEYAQRACKIPIVPVQVVPCEAPFLIFRLHQINFRYWRGSEATYQAGLNQICAASPKPFRVANRPNALGRRRLSRGILRLFYWKSAITSPAGNGSFETWTNGAAGTLLLRF
jgi:hypothetical protein